MAWALGLSGALACALTAGLTWALGLVDQVTPFVFGSLFGILMGVLGALVASREPRNSIGWLMCFTSFAACLVNLPTDYAYAALVVHTGSWPLGSPVLWFSTWSSVPIFGLLLPLILARFPDGHVRHRWRAAEWLAVLGTVPFILGVALPAVNLPLFISARAVALLAPYAHNPIGISVGDGPLAYLWMAGLATILFAYIAAAGSLITRFRSATSDESTQLKWFAYAGTLIAATVVYAVAAWNFFGQSFGYALIPFVMALVTLPLAIGIAILRYRLYDIDLIINRTLVYGGMTAIVAAAYTASITLFQRLFISVSGQKSDAAYVLVAFVVVVGFSPLKDWLQRLVNRRMGTTKPTQALDQFRSRVDAVVSVLDVERIACGLLDQVIDAFDVRGGALFLQPGLDSGPIYSRGRLDGDAGIEIPLRYRGRQLGRLVLSARRGGIAYTRQDLDAVQRSADSVGEAMALSGQLGLRPLVTHPTNKRK